MTVHSSPMYNISGSEHLSDAEMSKLSDHRQKTQQEVPEENPNNAQQQSLGDMKGKENNTNDEEGEEDTLWEKPSWAKTSFRLRKTALGDSVSQGCDLAAVRTEMMSFFIFKNSFV